MLCGPLLTNSRLSSRKLQRVSIWLWAEERFTSVRATEISSRTRHFSVDNAFDELLNLKADMVNQHFYGSVSRLPHIFAVLLSTKDSFFFGGFGYMHGICKRDFFTFVS
jgi:hypothetical protein